MGDLTLPIIGLTTMLGYYFSKDGKNTRETQVVNKIEAFEKPNGDNIYSSNKVNEVNLEILEKSFSNYLQAEEPHITGILPPLFNTYSVVGNDSMLTNESIIPSLSGRQQNEINDINKLKDITNTKYIEIDERPMFDKKVYEGTERNDNNYYKVGGDVDSQTSLLTGLPITNNHNNMVPFFGSYTKQNVEKFTNESLLDKYTGNASVFQHKKEQSKLFDNVKQDINGTPILTNKVEMDRYIPSLYRQNETPFDSERINAEKAGTNTNKILPTYKTVNELRVANNSKESYNGRIKAGQFGSVLGISGKVEKQRPDTFYEKNNGHLFTTIGKDIAPKIRENYQNIKPTNDIQTEYFGIANNEIDATRQRFGKNTFDSFVQETKKINHANDYVRNINGVKNTNDFGKSSMKLYDTERMTTGLKTHTVNINKSKSGAIKRFVDLPKTTLKETMTNTSNSGNIKTKFDKGISGAYDAGISDINAKTTHKETTIISNYKGIANKEDKTGYLVTKYDAKTTGKEILTNNSEYNGGIKSKDNNVLSRNNYLNINLRDNKELSLTGERPSGPQSFNISKGKVSFGETTNRQKERLDDRELLNVNLQQNIQTKNIIGVNTKIHLDNDTAVNDRLIPSLVYSQHNSNPYSLKKMN